MIKSSAPVKVDHQLSVSSMTGAGAYTAYGYQPSLSTSLGFTGQLSEPIVGWYMLGNGRRVFNSKVMRFHSPDAQAPFGKGGLNAYCYCGGDPVNNIDPTGQWKEAITRWTFGKLSIDFGSNIKGGYNWLEGFKPKLRMPTLREASGALAGTLKAGAMVAGGISVFLEHSAEPNSPADQAGYDANMVYADIFKYSALVMGTVGSTIELLTPTPPDERVALRNRIATLERENAMLRAARELRDEENPLMENTRM